MYNVCTFLYDTLCLYMYLTSTFTLLYIYNILTLRCEYIANTSNPIYNAGMVRWAGMASAKRNAHTQVGM